MAARIAGLLRTRSVPARSSSSTLLSGTSAKPKANHLAVIKAALGDLDRVERIVKIWGYVNVAPGVASLSRDAPVETEVIVQVRDK